MTIQTFFPYQYRQRQSIGSISKYNVACFIRCISAVLNSIRERFDSWISCRISAAWWTSVVDLSGEMRHHKRCNSHTYICIQKSHTCRLLSNFSKHSSWLWFLEDSLFPPTTARRKRLPLCDSWRWRHCSILKATSPLELKKVLSPSNGLCSRGYHPGNKHDSTEVWRQQLKKIGEASQPQIIGVIEQELPPWFLLHW